jgi:hypothetical protein
MVPKDQAYLIWAYENVGNGDVCSHSMYRLVGGTGGRDARAKVDTTRRDYRTYKPEEDDFPGKPKDTYESRDSIGRTVNDIDFPDDDIPF